MSKDLHKDDFEDFFKDTFEGQSEDASADGWDVPSEKVWENVDKVINPEEDDPIVGFVWWTGRRIWLILASILLISFIAFISFKYNQQQGQEIVETEDAVLEKKENTEILNELKKNGVDDNSNVEKVIELSNEALNTNSEKNDDTKTPQRTEVKSNLDKLDKTKSSENISIELKSNQTKTSSGKKLEPSNIPDIKKDSVRAKKDIAIQSESKLKIEFENKSNIIDLDRNPEKDNEIIESLDLIPMKILFVEIQNEETDTLAKTIAFTDFNDLVDLPNRKNRGLYAGLMFAPTSNYRDLQAKNRIAAAIDQFRNEIASVTFSAGIIGGYKLSKNWSIETGFNYAKMSIEHNRRKQLRYSAVGESMNASGEFEKDYSLDLVTSGGSVNTDVAVVRASGVSISENDFINLKLRTRNNISFANIPLVARYQFGKGKMQVGLKAGIVNRLVTKATLQAESVEVLRNGIRLVLNDRFYEPRTLKNLNSYEADFLIGAGIYYPFNDKFWLSVEPTITRSLNPIFEDQNFKTFPVFRSVDISVNYLF